MLWNILSLGQMQWGTPAIPCVINRLQYLIKCNMFYFGKQFSVEQWVVNALNVQCWQRSFTNLSPYECDFYCSLFPCDWHRCPGNSNCWRESCVLLLPSSHINIPPENFLSSPKSQIQHLSCFLYYTICTTSVNVVVRTWQK